MTDNDAWKVQASFKTPGQSLINVRGDNVEELNANLLAISESVALILSMEKSITAVETIATGLGLAEPAAQYEAQEANQQGVQAANNPWGQQQPQGQWDQGQPPAWAQQPQAVAQPNNVAYFPQQGAAFPGVASPVGPPQSAPAPGVSAPPAQFSTQPGQLMCKHNLAAKVVPAGISKASGKPYRAFAVCPLDKAQQCDWRQTL